MSWSEWIRTVEIEPAVNGGEPPLAQIEALLRSGCRVFGVGVHEGLDGLSLVERLAPLLHRYGGVLDVHLLGTADPALCALVAAAGGDSVTFQFEHADDLVSLGAAARAATLAIGVAFSADTAPELVAARLGDADVVRCPAGELAEQLERVRLLAGLVHPGVVIQAGGGIDHTNVRDYYDAGARVLLVGRAIFEREDLPRAYRRLVAALA